MKSRLYIANAMHARYAPAPHRFRYPVFTFAFDLDELPQLDREVSGFGYNRRALVSLHDRDYLRGEGTIRERLMRFLREAGCDDGTPGMCCGVSVIGFSREADCLEAAIRSAVADVQKAGCVVERVQIEHDSPLLSSGAE